MKRFVIVAVSLFFIVAGVSTALADKGQKGQFTTKAGEVIYVCSCGTGCDCGSLAKKEGTCGCGKSLVTSTVTKVEGGKVFYKLDGKELSAPITGTYACGCGEGCKCGSISQKPGKCSCGSNMVKVK